MPEIKIDRTADRRSWNAIGVALITGHRINAQGAEEPLTAAELQSLQLQTARKP